MKTYKIERVRTFDDDELCKAIEKIEADPNKKVKHVVYIGDNSQHIRIYQLIYTEEY